MPTPATYRYALKTEDNTKWYYVQGGAVLTSSTPKYLVDGSGHQSVSPLDWAQTQVGYPRNEKYYGVFTKFSTPLSFTFDAITILKKIYAQHGGEGTAIFVVDVLDNGSLTYSNMYTGELDLSQYENVEDIEEAIFYKANILERGLPELLKAQEDVPYELPFDNGYLKIYHDGTVLDFRYIFSSVYSLLDRLTSAEYIVPVTQISSNKVVDAFVLNSVQFGVTPAIDAEFFKSNSFVIPIYDITDGNIQVQWRGGIMNQSPSTDITFEMYIYIFRNNDFVTPVNAGNTTIYTDAPLSAGNQRSISFDVNYPFNFLKGDYVVLTARLVNIGSGGVIYDVFSYDTTRITLSGKMRVPPTEVKAYRYLDFLNKLFKSALGSTVNVVSQYLGSDQSYSANYDNNPKWTCVTSGSSLRQLPGPKMKTSIGDAFQDMRRWGLGLGIEGNNIRIERLPYFFQATRKIFTIKNVKSLRNYSANDYLATVIKTGYESGTNNENSSLQDFHTTSTWNFPAMRVKAEIDWVSKYRASIFEGEFARSRYQDNDDKTDSQYDNEIYLIEVNGDPATYNAGRPTLYRPSGFKYGIDNPDSAFNFGLTPATALHFNRELLTAMGYGKPKQSGYLKFQTGIKNNSFARKLSSIEIDEDLSRPLQAYTFNADGTPVTPLFQPTVIEIDAVVPENLFDIMNSDYQNRYGVITFPWKGTDFDIFILDIALNPETKDLYTIRGLSSPHNDLSKL